MSWKKSEYDPAFFDTFSEIESGHFWFEARNRVIAKLFHQFVDQDSSILEIGAGTCFVAAMLQKEGYTVTVSDVHQDAAAFAQKKGIDDFILVDIGDDRFSLERSSHAIGLFDVLEHVENDERALRNIHRILKENGKLILTVPAHRWLWNRSDEIAFHKRRYTLNGLTTLLNTSGFQVLEGRYFFTLLIPFFFLRKCALFHSRTIFGSKLPPFINSFFSRILHVDNLLQRHFKFPVGGSIAIVAKKI